MKFYFNLTISRIRVNRRLPGRINETFTGHRSRFFFPPNLYFSLDTFIATNSTERFPSRLRCPPLKNRIVINEILTSHGTPTPKVIDRTSNPMKINFYVTKVHNLRFGGSVRVSFFLFAATKPVKLRALSPPEKKINF